VLLQKTDVTTSRRRFMFDMTVLTSAVTREHYTSWLNASLLTTKRLSPRFSTGCVSVPSYRTCSADTFVTY